MTANPTGSRLSTAAQQMLEAYLQELRMALRGCESVDPKEVESDVRLHIDQELAEQPAPVSGEALGAILNKLGSPTQWVPIDELPWWRRMLIRLRMGPTSDRWAIKLFILFILGLLLVPAAGFGLILILASFLLARATLAMCDDAGEELRWRRWLVYPPLVVIYLIVLVVLLAWPALAGGIPHTLAPSLSRTGGGGHTTAALRSSAMALFIAAAALGIWWALLSATLLYWPRWPAALFRPFAVPLPRKLGFALLLLSLCFAVGGVIGVCAWLD
jgi:hypothetical protein